MSEHYNIDLGLDSGKLLCEILGLDPNEVRAITLRWSAGERPTCEVEMILNKQVVHEVMHLVIKPSTLETTHD